MSAHEHVFAMPDLGEGLEEGEIVAWLVAEGDSVSLNQPLVEMETAKATVEIPSPVAGSVTMLHGVAGETVAVGAPLATFSVAGEGAGDRAPVAATPAVRKLAKELGVDLASVVGTGQGGRIGADDVRGAAGTGTTSPAAPGQLTQAAAPAQPAPDRVRRAIAETLTRQAAIPQVTVFRTVDCSALEDLRTELGTSPLPVVVAALARMVTAHPNLNAEWKDGGARAREAVHVGLAVDTERGLMVAVVRDAAGRSIGDLAAEITRLAAAARSGTMSPDASATIAVSNTGSYGSEAGTPILSPGTSITLAIGTISPRALVVDGEVVARPACTLSCTFDHRVLDGATLGRALTELVDTLSSPHGLGELPR